MSAFACCCLGVLEIHLIGFLCVTTRSFHFLVINMPSTKEKEKKRTTIKKLLERWSKRSGTETHLCEFVLGFQTIPMNWATHTHLSPWFSRRVDRFCVSAIVCACTTFELLWFPWLDMHEQQADMTNNALFAPLFFLLFLLILHSLFHIRSIRTCFRFLFSTLYSIHGIGFLWPWHVRFGIGVCLDWICCAHCVTW